MSTSLVIIPLVMAAGVSEAASDAYQICEGFVEATKLYSTQELPALTFMRKTIAQADEVSDLEALYKRKFDGLLQTYTDRGLGEEQARAEMLGDLKAWEISQLNMAIKMQGVTDEKEWTVVYKGCLDNLRG